MVRQLAKTRLYPHEMSDSLFGPPSSRPWGRPAESGIVRRPESASARAVASMRRGDSLFEADDYEGAAREFVQALDVLDGRGCGLTVDVYLRLGRTNHALGRVTACMHCYKKGLEADPEHAPTLAALAALHLDWSERRSAEAVEERLFACAGNAEEQVMALVRSGDRWWKQEKDLARAKQRYRRALYVFNSEDMRATTMRERILARLRAISAATERALVEQVADAQLADETPRSARQRRASNRSADTNRSRDKSRTGDEQRSATQRSEMDGAPHSRLVRRGGVSRSSKTAKSRS